MAQSFALCMNAEARATAMILAEYSERMNWYCNSQMQRQATEVPVRDQHLVWKLLWWSKEEWTMLVGWKKLVSYSNNYKGHTEHVDKTNIQDLITLAIIAWQFWLSWQHAITCIFRTILQISGNQVIHLKHPMLGLCLHAICLAAQAWMRPCCFTVDNTSCQHRPWCMVWKIVTLERPGSLKCCIMNNLHCRQMME